MFEDAEVSINSIATRCRFLKSIAKVKKAISVPVLSKKNKKSRLEWCKKYHKANFENVIFSDECSAYFSDNFIFGYFIQYNDSKIRYFS